MATKKYGSMQQQQKPTTVEERDESDLHVIGGEAAAPAESKLVVEEVSGNVSPDQFASESGEETDAGAHEEVSADGAEAAEEYAEASPEQLTATASQEDNASSDFRNIEGYEEFVGEEAAEEAAARGLLPDAGTAVDGKQEFLPFIAAAAASVLPTLVSKIGPKVARGVIQKLTPRAKALLKARKKGGGPLALIAKLLETAEQQPAEAFGTEAGMEVDEAMIDETAQVLEVIIGTDDRIRITPTQRIPWRRICALRIYMPSGAVFRGTGFFIGPRALATAGHCVYMHNQGGWARKVEVIPGCNGTQQPFGMATATTFRSVNGWIQGKKPDSDYACIVVPAGGFKQALGSFGFGVFPSSVLLAQPVVVAGYPGDKPFAQLWGMSRKLKAVTALQLVYDIDTVGGQSGCPVYMKKGGKRYVVGIHNYGAATGNSATRITEAVFNNLLQWSKIGTTAAAQPKTTAAAA
jgi:glutamyl endopeptidase